MRRRLYFLLPDVDSSKRTADDLLLARVEDRHMRFLSKRGTDLEPLHEAGYVDKSDMIHGAVVGLALGGLIGALVGALVVAYPPDGMNPQLVAVLIGLLGGAAFGVAIATIVGAAVPNSRLRQFDADLDSGRVLLMVDVPSYRVDEITALVVSRHPEAVPRGEALRYVFP